MKDKFFMSLWIASEQVLLAMTKKRTSLRAKRSNPETRKFKHNEYIYAALVSLSFHGVLAALLIPSVFKVFPEAPVSFEVAWVVPSTSCQSQSSPRQLPSPSCHPRESEDPGKNRTVIPNLFRDPVPKKMLKQAQHEAPLDPRLRGDDKRVRREDNDTRHCEALQEPKQPRKPTPAGVLSATRKNEAPRAQPHHPLPLYPWVCRKRGQEGIVCLHVKTNKEGHVIEASLHKSSGHDLLDKAALEAVKSWILSEINSDKTLSITFRLKGEDVSLS